MSNVTQNHRQVQLQKLSMFLTQVQRLQEDAEYLKPLLSQYTKGVVLMKGINAAPKLQEQVGQQFKELA